MMKAVRGAPWVYCVLGSILACGCSDRASLDHSDPDRLLGVQSAPLVWAGERRLVASDGAAADYFGMAVSLSGPDALIGMRDDDDLGTSSGSARLYVQSAGGWSELPKLTASDGVANDNFGMSVALRADTAIVSAPYDDDKGNNSGSVYVFSRADAMWTEQPKLTASDGAASDNFGISIALSDDAILVGAYGDDDKGSDAGAAYVFERDGNGWTERPKLLPLDGQAADIFGHAVALSGNTALIGAPYDDDKGASSGSAYVFVRDAIGWSEQQKLVASDGTGSDLFGYSVALSGDVALIGAYADGAARGSAYVFTRSGTTWTEQPKLLASDGAAGDFFGFSVSLAGDVALIGAAQDDGPGTDSGSAYVFGLVGTTWTEQKKLTASDGSASDFFGRAVAVSSGRALVGAPYDDDAGTDRGSVYAFALLGSDGDPCSVDGDCASEHCVDDVCCNDACAGACAACSVQTGAEVDGTCKALSAGALGSPACGSQTCNGVDLDCQPCAGDTQCPSGTYCAADGTCAAKKDVGSACDLAAGADCLQAGCGSCASGHCSDGTCCGSACDGTCEACIAALTGGTDGSCEPTLADEDPNDDCSPSAGYPADCGGDGTCDGQGACRSSAKEGTECGETAYCTAGGTCEAEPTPDEPTPDEPTPDEPTPDEPTPDEPTPDEPTPDEPTPDEPTPDEPTPDEPTPDDRPAGDDAGCGCRMPGRPTGGAPAWSVLLLIALLRSASRRCRESGGADRWSR